MSITGMIRETMRGYRAQKNETRAKKLQELRTKRLRVEGEAKIIKLQNKEKQRISKAKKIKQENSFIGNIRKELKSNLKAKKSTGGLGSELSGDPWGQEKKNKNKYTW